MSATQAQDERVDFSKRLQKSLLLQGYPTSPTELVREFNARFSGMPITVHAARKWLIAEAIPTQEKLRVLADWLCSTPEWLRYGTGTNATPAKPERVDAEIVHLVADLKHLDPKRRKLAHEFVRMLVREAA